MDTLKLISFVLALYTLALSVLPCEERDGCNDPLPDSGMEAIVESHTNNGDGSLCSPFCPCTCLECQALYLVLLPVSQETIFLNFAPVTSYFPYYTDDFPMGLWKPPRVA